MHERWTCFAAKPKRRGCWIDPHRHRPSRRVRLRRLWMPRTFSREGPNPAWSSSDPQMSCDPRHSSTWKGAPKVLPDLDPHGCYISGASLPWRSTSLRAASASRNRAIVVHHLNARKSCAETRLHSVARPAKLGSTARCFERKEAVAWLERATSPAVTKCSHEAAECEIRLLLRSWFVHLGTMPAPLRGHPLSRPAASSRSWRLRL